MKLNRKEAAFLKKIIDHWVEEGLLSKEKGDELEQNLEVSTFNWKSIAQTAFVIAILSGLISFIIVLEQKLLVDLFYRLINAPYPLLSLFFAVLAGIFYGWGYRRKQRKPAREYSNEALLLIGGAFTGAAVAFFGRSLGEEMGHYSLLFLLATVIYLVLARLFNSVPLWAVGLLGLACWFGTETIYLSGDDSSFLGMNLPLRFCWFGLFLLIVERWSRRYEEKGAFQELSYFMSLLYFFSALWLLSIFGNYSDWAAWKAAPWSDFAGFSLVLALVSALAVWWGAREKDDLLRGFGIIFFLLNLYTKYVEYGWDYLHRALFFAILALSFWMIGRRAEEIWEYRPGVDSR